MYKKLAIAPLINLLMQYVMCVGGTSNLDVVVDGKTLGAAADVILDGPEVGSHLTIIRP